MRKFSAFWIVLILLLSQKLQGIDPGQLEEALKQKHGYSVLTVTRKFTPHDNSILTREDLSKILEKITETLEQEQSTTFVVFNEYFFF